MRIMWDEEKITAWLRKHRFYGELVDDDWVSTKHRHNWRCYFDHTFGKRFEDIRREMKFCPECAPTYQMQEYTRFVFQQLTGKRFPLRRDLDWLRNDKTGEFLELDGYNEELGVAFEYDGAQHAKRVEQWQDEAEHDEQKRRDDLKDALCEKNKVALIRVGHDLRIGEIEAHVVAELRKKGLEHVIVGAVDKSKYNPATNYELLKEAREYAGEKGGECRQESIVTASEPITFYCPIHDHEWTVSLASLRHRESWCKYCSRAAVSDSQYEEKGKEHLDTMAANFPGYKCLSQNYAGAKEDYQWQCPGGHPPFWLSYSEAQSAHRRGQQHICPVCNKKRRITIGDMHTHAEKHGGTCLTKELDEKGKTVVRFECGNKEHEPFTYTATMVKNNPNLWCPICQNRKKFRHDIAFVRSLCEKNNFELSSDEYKSNTILMKARCKKCGHEIEKHLRWMQHKDGSQWCDMCVIAGD